MRGIIHLMVQSAHLKYEMDFLRNITILKGDSATGKTTLIDMIQEYNLNGSDTGISLNCNCPCRVLAGNTWMEQLKEIHHCLIFIDEGNRFVASEEFARAIRVTDNYYVIVTREGLSNLPYSVTEIYGIHSSGKYAYQEPIYHHLYRIYGNYQQPKEALHGQLIVEDSNAGYDFFLDLSCRCNISCVTANGAGNIFGMLQKSRVNDGLTVIADGAAFGAHMEKIYQMIQRYATIQLYLPESFEWLLLSSGLVNDNEVKMALANPSEYIDSEEYFSWERYFTQLLNKKTEGMYLQYSKSKLNPAFLQKRNRDRIIGAMPDQLRRLFEDVEDDEHINTCEV